MKRIIKNLKKLNFLYATAIVFALFVLFYYLEFLTQAKYLIIIFLILVFAGSFKKKFFNPPTPKSESKIEIDKQEVEKVREI